MATETEPPEQAQKAFCEPECDWTAKVTHFIGAKITINTCMLCGRYDADDINAQISRIVQLERAAERVDNERRRIALKMAYDMDRCEHGRHEGDPCFGCPGGYSKGNPHLKVGEPFAYGLSGLIQYVLPPREKRLAVENWVQNRP